MAGSRPRWRIALMVGIACLSVMAMKAARAEPQAPPLSQGAPPSHPNFGAIGQPRPSVSQTLSDRNAAYFNRPGAIPRSSFQPVNNNAPIVQQQAAPTPIVAGPAPAPTAVLPSGTQTSAPLAKADPAPVTPPASRTSHILIRPAPVAPRILKERSRAVPSPIIQPKPLQARVYPAHGPQPLRGAPGAIQQVPAAGQSPTAAGLQQLQSTQPSGVRPGTILAPPAIARPGSIQRQAIIPRPYSQTTGSVPTLAPRPHSIFEGPKPKAPLDPTASKAGTACAAGLTSC